MKAGFADAAVMTGGAGAGRNVVAAAGRPSGGSGRCGVLLDLVRDCGGTGKGIVHAAHGHGFGFQVVAFGDFGFGVVPALADTCGYAAAAQTYQKPGPDGLKEAGLCIVGSFRDELVSGAAVAAVCQTVVNRAVQYRIDFSIF